VLIPDLSVSDQRIASAKKIIAESQESSKAKLKEIELLKSDQEFAKYLGLHEGSRAAQSS